MTQTPERTTPATPPEAIDQGKLEAFLGKVVDEVGAAYNTVLTAIGDQLAKALLGGDVREGDTVSVDLDEHGDHGAGSLVVSRAAG